MSPISSNENDEYLLKQRQQHQQQHQQQQQRQFTKSFHNAMTAISNLRNEYP